MKSTKLTADQLVLLREVLDTRAPSLVDDFMGKVLAGTLTRAERQQLCVFIGEEFAATGIGHDSEPSRRGNLLEGLIDVINRSNLTNGE